MKASISGTDSLVMFRNSQGLEGRGTLLHLTRNQAVFEVYNPYSIVQLSEVLADLRILRGERTIYSGRAVASHLLPTGIMVIVSATLVDAWSDLAGLETTEGIRDEVAGFVRNWEDTYALRPSFQLAVSTLRSFLGELSRWLGQVEAVSGPGNAAPDLRREFTQEVEEPLVPKLAELFCRFEDEAAEVPPAEVDAHKGFARREIHPLLLCSPFVHRTYTKPLGYAGDYEMVNMLLADPLQGSTTYARIVNAIAIRSPTGQGHRNRIAILLDRLRGEAARVEAAGRAPLRVLNVGCGPAREVEDFLLTDPLANRCQLRLMDFNDETIRYTEARLRQALRQAAPSAEVEMVHRSIHDLLKDASRRREATAPQYDLVYCAGLFDYLGDRVCRQLVRLFWEWTVPGGLVLTTNVHRSNPIRQFMEYLLEWYLVYRDEAGMESLAPPDAPRRVYTDPTGVNVFLELRKGGEHP